MGIQRVKPAKAIKEAVQVIRKLLHGDSVDFRGEVVQCYGGKLNFQARDDIPIIVATRGDLVLKTAGEVADGVMIATYAQPYGIRYALSLVEQGTQSSGRRLNDLTLISRVDACISENRRAAVDALKPMVGVFLWTSYPDRTFVHRMGLTVPDELEAVIARRDYNQLAPNAHLVPDEFVDKFCWAGTAEDVAQKVAQVARLGIENITFLPHPPLGGSIHETIRAFARIVKPRVEDLFASRPNDP
jgi:5,10-methylenetetrahydromethanopterin reductase